MSIRQNTIAEAESTDLSTGLDTWAARNLGFLSVLIVTLGFLGMVPFVLGLIMVVYPLFHSRQNLSLGEISFGISSIILSLTGLFLLVEYWIYPRMLFRIPGLIFWVISSLYCPIWLLLGLVTVNRDRLPTIEELAFAWAFIVAGLLFPFAHFSLSILGLYTCFLRRTRAT